MTDWTALRREFPALASQAYLNTAAGAPMSQAAAAAARDYYSATERDGDIHWDAWMERLEQVRATAAGLLGTGARHIAFVQNCSAAMNLVAQRLQGQGDVLLVRDDFPSVTYPWMTAGFHVDFAESEGGGASVEALEAAATASTRILAVGLVNYRTGFRYDLAALGDLCRAHDWRLVIDATQGLGAVRVEPEAAGVDFLVSSGYKWLTSGYGFGLLYLGDEHLDAARHRAAGWRSARDPYALVSDQLDLSPEARALELGHPPFAAILGLGAALDMQATAGSEAIERRVLDLAGELRAVLTGAGLRVPPRRSDDRGSGIVFAASDLDPQRLRNELLARGVYVSARGGGLRCSTHFYNDRSDLDRLREALAAILSRPEART